MKILKTITCLFVVLSSLIGHASETETKVSLNVPYFDQYGFRCYGELEQRTENDYYMSARAGYGRKRYDGFTDSLEFSRYILEGRIGKKITIYGCDNKLKIIPYTGLTFLNSKFRFSEESLRVSMLAIPIGVNTEYEVHKMVTIGLNVGVKFPFLGTITTVKKESPYRTVTEKKSGLLNATKFLYEISTPIITSFDKKFGIYFTPVFEGNSGDFALSSIGIKLGLSYTI